MLEIEEFKKIFDNFEVEGFSDNPYQESIRKICMRGKCVTDTQEILYPLFLQKVRKGINKNDESDYFIDLSRHYCRVISWNCNVIEEYPDTDEGLEQAIKFVLEQI